MSTLKLKRWASAVHYPHTSYFLSIIPLIALGISSSRNPVDPPHVRAAPRGTTKSTKNPRCLDSCLIDTGGAVVSRFPIEINTHMTSSVSQSTPLSVVATFKDQAEASDSIRKRKVGPLIVV